MRAQKLVDGANEVNFALVVTTTGGTIEDTTDDPACLGFCPHRCSFRGFCNLNGQCECTPGYEGLDCSLSKCPNDCSGNGVCDGLTGKCACGQFWAGDACNVAIPEGTAEVIVVPGNCSGDGGVGVGVVVGIAFAVFIFGFLLGMILGAWLGIRWLIQRKKAKVAEMRQQMASKQAGGGSAGTAAP